MRYLKNQRGFLAIELGIILTFILVIAVVVATQLPQIAAVLEKGRIEKESSVMSQDF